MRDTRRTRVVLAALLLGGFALITLDANGDRPGAPGPLGKVRSAGQAVFGPVERASDGAVRGVGSLFTGWGHSDADKSRITRLTAQVSSLKSRLETGGETQARAAQLDGLLKLTSLGGLTTVPARLIGLAPAQDGTWAATIDAGSRDGVRENQTVIDGDGLVGRTTDVGPDTATVLLAMDPASTVGVRLAGAGTIGTATGQDPHTLKIQFLDPQLQVKPGAVVVTLGSAGDAPFVPGVPVGVVRSVQPTPGALTRTVLVTPYVDATSVDTVAVVVQPPRTDPRNAMVPGAH
ncbi:MAG: rod shape-determining protein MreC [Actinocrinis sp.]